MNIEDIIRRIVIKMKAFNEITSHSVQTRPFYLSNTADAVISGYKILTRTNDSALTTVTTTVKQSESDKLIYAFLLADSVGTTTIDAGTWTFDMCAGINSCVGVTRFKFVVFKRDTGGTETTLFSVTSNPLKNLTANGLKMLKTRYTQPPFTVATTDRIGVKVYVLTNNQTSLTVSVGIGGTVTTSYISTPMPLTHAEIIKLNGDAAYQHITAADRTLINNYPAEVVDWGTTYTATIVPNKYNLWGTLTSANTLAITLGSTTSGIMNNFMFEFKTGASVPTFSTISGVTWVGSTPTLAINKTYQFSIVNGIGVWAYA
jgi:hypothetical protein